MLGSAPFFRDTTMFTIATGGYVPFVLNLMSSMNESGLDPRHLVVYVLDDEAGRRLLRAGVPPAQLRRHDAGRVERWSDWDTTNFARVVSAKFGIGASLLVSGKNALFVDGDIVVRRDPTRYLALTAGQDGTDMVMQFESPKDVYNTGFWYAHRTTKSIDLLRRVERSLLASEFTCDQECFNSLLPLARGLRVRGLDVKLFACGNQFYDALAVADNAYILHFNYLVGRDRKLLAMERVGGILHESLAKELRRAKLRMPLHRALSRVLRAKELLRSG